MEICKKVFYLPATYLDCTPMYLVVVQALSALFIYACLLAGLGILSYSLMSLLLLFGLAVSVSLLVNVLCAKALSVPAQHLSALISALIIVFLANPVTTMTGAWFVVVFAVLAMVSKYVLVYKKQHIVNPVAIGAVLVSFLGIGGALWWVATPLLLIPVLLAGVLVVSKIRRWSMVMAFLLAGYATYWIEMWRFDAISTTTWSVFWVSYPMLFLAFFMLTEPFTMPGTKRLQIVYGVLVGVLANTSVFNSLTIMTPELALVIGNIVVYPWSLRQKLYLTLERVREVSPRIFEFTFTKPSSMRFTAGQYLEWMVPHTAADARGVRRYFTIVSHPEEETIAVTMKIPTEKASTYKQVMSNFTPGAQVIASQLAGDFILPNDTQKKLAWVAGGIGVTPFVSQAASLRVQNESRDIVMLYATATAADQAYGDVLDAVVTRVPIIASGSVPTGAESGYVSADIITRRVPDYRDRLWYVSGPPQMVNATTKALTALGVTHRNIKTDFFPGLA